MSAKRIAKLRKREKAAFIRRQKAWITYADKCKRTCEAYDEVGRTWAAVLPAQKAKRESLNALIDQLGRRPRPSEYSPEYLAARKLFLSTMAAHKSAKTEYLLRRKERNHYNAIYNIACSEHEQARNELMAALSSKPKLDSDTVIREVDMAQVESKPFYLANLFGKNAVVVRRSDGSGKIDIYFDGIADNGNGIGHGHAVIDASGKVVYLRDSWCNHDDSIINDYHPSSHSAPPAS